MPRYEHWLRKTKSETQPKQIVCVETEARLVRHPELADTEMEVLTSWHTVVWKNQGCHAAGRQRLKGNNPADFWSSLDQTLQRGALTWLFCMPASRVLTLLGFWEMLESGEITLQGKDARDERDSDGYVDKRHAGYCVLEDPPTIILCRRKGINGHLKIVDLRNYGVANWNALLGDGSRVDRLASFVCSMLSTLVNAGLGALQNTSASQALFSYRKKYHETTTLIHTCPEALASERKAYYGGRCECFTIGRREGPIYQVDFRSFYHWIAATIALPVRLVDLLSKEQIGRVSESLLDSEHMVEDGKRCGSGLPCRTQSSFGLCSSVRVCCKRPVFPLRQNGLTIYPVGTFDTWLCWPELKYAINHDMVVDIGECWQYECSSAFALWSADMTRMRQEAKDKGDIASEQWIKYFGLALYGKWGQLNVSWKDEHKQIADEPYSTWWESGIKGEPVRWRSLAWYCQRESKPRPGDCPGRGSGDYDRWATETIARETAESSPAISAWITSAGRIALYEAMEIAGLDNTYYCATDSLFINRAGLDNLYRSGYFVDGSAGGLRIVAEYTWVDFRGINHYITPDGHKCAGMPKGFVEPGQDGESYYYRYWLGRACLDGHRPEAQRVILSYERNGSYQHGQLLQEGRVKPWVMNQGLPENTKPDS